MITKDWIMKPDGWWKSIIFSDESKFNLYASDGKYKRWVLESERGESCNLAKTIKYGGGSVMVWGCFTYHGVGELVFIDGTMDAAKYVNILANNLLPLYANSNVSDLVFQQDNDPKHTSGLAKTFFSRNNINVLKWPSNSPDLNPIENLWAIIKRRLHGIIPQNKEDLKRIIMVEWNKITSKICQNLVLSMSKRAMMCYRNKGMNIGK